MFSTRSPQLSVRVLVWSVLRVFRGGTVQGLIFVIVQVYPPAGVIFTGIGVLLSVSIFSIPLLRRPKRPHSLRRPRPFLPARMRSRTYLSVSRISFDASRPMSKFHRRQG